jgi:hypothetical protein
MTGTELPTAKASDRRGVILAGAIALVAILVIAVTAVVMLRGAAGAGVPRDSEHPVAPGLLSMTLTADEINDILGTTDTAPRAMFGRLADDTVVVEPADCRTVFSPALYQNYSSTDYLTVLGRDYQRPSVRYFWLRVAVFAVPSADRATGFLEDSTRWWQSCRGNPFKYAADPSTWSIDDLSVHDDKIVAAFHADGTVTKCQRALAAVQSFVIDVGICTDQATDGADQIAAKLMAKA